jgi:hypothetical protein
MLGIINMMRWIFGIALAFAIAAVGRYQRRRRAAEVAGLDVPE